MWPAGHLGTPLESTRFDAASPFPGPDFTGSVRSSAEVDSSTVSAVALGED